MDIVWIDNKKYRKGYTTGSCATAAAKVAALMVLEQTLYEQVTIITPSNVKLDLDVIDPIFDKTSATAAIQKDGGDDIDVTHGMLIYAKVTLNGSGEINLDGGVGIGRVTRKGVRHQLGDPAINDTPRRTIVEAVREVIGDVRGADILIYAPEGIDRAQQTFNPRLGIVGGISILGTTGIVKPMSEESWKTSITLEIEMKHEEGYEQLIFVPGNHGEEFAKILGMNPNQVIIMSNFVRHVLKEAERLGFKHILLLGHFGKLIKVAAGIFHTHNHVADGRIETLVAMLALMGAPLEFLQQIDECKTTEAATELIDEAGFQTVYNMVAKRIHERSEQLSQYTKNPLTVDAIICGMDGTVLGSSRPLPQLIKEFSA